ncbi:complement C1q tumor necrosis factor-related protein 3-like [Mytilus edulis]|uniref:complement C1q tumor necrosis factor-related protein 3-like n=1 Tax=Mytilus edulis TaxID=6550 RepID=UPI0039F0C083
MNFFINFILLFLFQNLLSDAVEDTQFQRLEHAVYELQQQRLEDVRRINSLENELSLQNRRTRLLLGSVVPEHSKVSFMAHLSTDLSRVGNNHTIHFDRVITNNGQSYNPLDGIFHTPVTGTYVFIWTTTNRDHSYMNSELLKNGVRVARAMSDAMDHADYAVATSFAVINLTEGDEVWIQSGTWHSGALAGDDYSSFAGWILN